MKWYEKIRLVFHVLRWRFTWGRRDLKFLPENVDSPKFITAEKAASLIPDNATVFSSGIAGNARCSIFFWAIKEHFKKTQHPQNLTWMNGGAQGSRGHVPGTLEELGLPGLISRYIAAHLETTKAELKLADEGKLELHTLPQGVISLLLEEQANGNITLRSKVGVGSFLDPRFGGGSAVTPHTENEFVQSAGDELIYTLPKVDFALFNAPYADAEGNIYFKNAATITEDVQSLKAAHANGGKVMVTVSDIIQKSDTDISLRASEIDFIVVNPWSEQTSSVLQKRYWSMFTPNPNTDVRLAMKKLKFINNLLKITPIRGKMEELIVRLAVQLFLRIAPKGAMINIGVGLPEEVSRLLVQNNLENKFTFTTEAGSFGGIPAPGIFFGAAVNPIRLEPSSRMFRRYLNELDVAILGFLQVDSEGNVNVSKRGQHMVDYVGPGGFPDIVSGASTIIFIGKWMVNAKFTIDNKSVQIKSPGKPKFVRKVDEVTFNGKEAFRHGKQVYYVTNVGIFKLIEEGLELMLTLPGINIERDILDATEARIHLPKDKKVPVANTDLFDERLFLNDWDSPTSTFAHF